ncbi:hypothetical protein [Membranihabitans maritimus]|uniref:hypothetical protein n=1 Tax=Membranihabitans maritimus TaxID=2904244 RepID=UPI001F43A1F7|nr:hypothetical protein [Membranihabitans maritimus]
MKKENSFIYYDEEEQLFVGVYVYKNSGEYCPYYILKGGVFKQAAAYISMKKDLMDCLQSIVYLEQINDNPSIPQIVKSSLLFASIVKYAKCFTTGEGRGTSLNESHIFKEASHLLSFHQETMELRHKYLAHAGNSVHESRALIALLNPDEMNKSRESIQYGGFRLKDDDSNIDNYKKLYNWVQEQIDLKLDNLKPIVNQRADEIPIEEMYLNAKIPDPEKFLPFTVNLM